jgi:hypothetical protein
VKRRLFFQSGSFHDRVLAGPGVGVIAFLIGITTFINRDERRFRLQLAVYSAIIGVHFFLMGAGPAGMSAGLNALRTVISCAPVACG